MRDKKRKTEDVVDTYVAAVGRLAGPPPRRLLVALSGGADSTALLTAAVLAADRLGAPPDVVAACHVDHGARGREDDAAEAFCLALAGHLSVELFVEHVAVERAGKGWEDAARRRRYAALEHARRTLGADWILTGHTADDVAETVLMRLARGASARGLGGIPEKSGRVIRPLLAVRRQALRDWLPTVSALEVLATERPWVEDSTNLDPAFLRNRVRGEVLPPLEEAIPQAVPSIARAAALLREDDDYLDGLAREALAGSRLSGDELRLAVRGGLRLAGSTHAYRLSRLALVPAPLLRRALRAALIYAGVSGDDLESRHVLALADAVVAGRPCTLELPDGVRALIRRGTLLVNPPAERPGDAQAGPVE